ncbi:MAG: MATE family efflux transporter [Oscillospiraceae bacterium]|nr:MATE family efflux transporter [Oscillospiraceae bacterium]
MLKSQPDNIAFYRRVLIIALPIILQNAITNFVSMLDNVMVGQLATAQIAGVTIANNNLLFIFNLCIFGGAAGAGIFTTQYHGSQDHEGIRYTFRFKLAICLILTVIGVSVFLLFTQPLVGLYLKGDGDPQLAADTLLYGSQYIRIMVIGFLPFALTNAYASTLRECGHTVVPMVASLIATLVNLFFNYLLIFGNWGFPMLGVSGAAIATVISRYAELAIVVLWTHRHSLELPFVKGLYRSVHIPKDLLRTILIKGSPLLFNELLWSTGLAFQNQCYSLCGLEVVPALSISTTIYNLAGVVFRSLGSTVGIITGQMLGAGRPEKEVREANKKMEALTICSGVVFALVMGSLAFVYPKLYNTTESVRTLATWLIVISALYMPLQAYIFSVFFTLRAGGKTIITFLFDCGAIWAYCVPAAFLLCNFTQLPILLIFALCNAGDIIKCFIGAYMIRKGTWIQNLAVKE